MFSISQIRAQARQTIDQTKGSYLLGVAPVLISICASIITLLLRPSSTVGQLAWAIFVAILNAFINCSVLYTLLTIIRHRKETASFTDAFSIFCHPKFGKLSLTILVKVLLLTLGSLLSSTGYVYLLSVALYYDSYSSENILMGTIIGLMLILIGVAIYLLILLNYTLVEILALEQLEVGTYTGPMEIFKESRRLMNGYKGNLFVFILSFIGWGFLVAISLGLAGIYVYPYYNTATIYFYDALLENRKQKEELLAGKFN